jgi:hypothetical protein
MCVTVVDPRLILASLRGRHVACQARNAPTAAATPLQRACCRPGKGGADMLANLQLGPLAAAERNHGRCKEPQLSRLAAPFAAEK